MKEHRENILKIIHKYRKMCGIQECYFNIPEIKIGRIEKKKLSTIPITFSLGPSFRYENEWTIKKLDEVRSKFTTELAQYVTKNTEYDGLIISTVFYSWMVIGYNLEFTTKI